MPRILLAFRQAGTPPPAPLAVSLSAVPTSGSVGESAVFTASVTNATGAVSVAFYDASDDSLVSTDAAAPYNAAVPFVDGQRSVYAVATDAEGSATSGAVTVTGTAAPPPGDTVADLAALDALDPSAYTAARGLPGEPGYEAGSVVVVADPGYVPVDADGEPDPSLGLAFRLVDSSEDAWAEFAMPDGFAVRVPDALVSAEQTTTIASSGSSNTARTVTSGGPFASLTLGEGWTNGSGRSIARDLYQLHAAGFNALFHDEFYTADGKVRPDRGSGRSLDSMWDRAVTDGATEVDPDAVPVRWTEATGPLRWVALGTVETKTTAPVRGSVSYALSDVPGTDYHGEPARLPSFSYDVTRRPGVVLDARLWGVDVDPMEATYAERAARRKARTADVAADNSDRLLTAAATLLRYAKTFCGAVSTAPRDWLGADGQARAVEVCYLGLAGDAVYQTFRLPDRVFLAGTGPEYVYRTTTLFEGKPFEVTFESKARGGLYVAGHTGRDADLPENANGAAAGIGYPVALERHRYDTSFSYNGATPGQSFYLKDWRPEFFLGQSRCSVTIAANYRDQTTVGALYGACEVELDGQFDDSQGYSSYGVGERVNGRVLQMNYWDTTYVQNTPEWHGFGVGPDGSGGSLAYDTFSDVRCEFYRCHPHGLGTNSFGSLSRGVATLTLECSSADVLRNHWYGGLEFGVLNVCTGWHWHVVSGYGEEQWGMAAGEMTRHPANYEPSYSVFGSRLDTDRQGFPWGRHVRYLAPMGDGTTTQRIRDAGETKPYSFPVSTWLKFQGGDDVYMADGVFLNGFDTSTLVSTSVQDPPENPTFLNAASERVLVERCLVVDESGATNHEYLYGADHAQATFRNNRYVNETPGDGGRNGKSFTTVGARFASVHRLVNERTDLELSYLLSPGASSSGPGLVVSVEGPLTSMPQVNETARGLNSDSREALVFRDGAPLVVNSEGDDDAHTTVERALFGTSAVARLGGSTYPASASGTYAVTASDVAAGYALVPTGVLGREQHPDCLAVTVQSGPGSVASVESRRSDGNEWGDVDAYFTRGVRLRVALSGCDETTVLAWRHRVSLHADAIESDLVPLWRVAPTDNLVYYDGAGGVLPLDGAEIPVGQTVEVPLGRLAVLMPGGTFDARVDAAGVAAGAPFSGPVYPVPLWSAESAAAGVASVEAVADPGPGGSGSLDKPAGYDRSGYKYGDGTIENHDTVPDNLRGRPQTLLVTGVAAGTTTVTVTAEDPLGVADPITVSATITVG